MADRLGFIGLGRMGSAMVKRLCETGSPPTIWNRDPSKAARLQPLGCAVARTPQELAARPAAPAAPVRNTLPKVGRNDPCPCGSGKKYKKCHGA